MTEVPVIVISSSEPTTGKSTVALNLAAALWSDGYKIKLWAPDNLTVADFMEKRKQMNRQCKIALPMPEIVDFIGEYNTENSVVIAVIPSDKNEQYLNIFSMAHTLISIGCEQKDFAWTFSHPYINTIWQAKKAAAAKGIKYLNWIVLQNQLSAENEDLSKYLQLSAKQFGFRIAEPLHWRNSYRYVQNGYCASDMPKYRQIFKMSMDDVYARREILNLTDDLWKHK